MIVFVAIIVLMVLLAIATGVYAWTRKSMLRSGWSQSEARIGATAACIVLSLPITWDAIPTWIAFEYYARKEAGITVFKTLEQWKAENPGVAETLEAFGIQDKRRESTQLNNNQFRHLLNSRFAYTDQHFDRLFLSVYAHRFSVIDAKSNEVLVKYVEVGSGNDGGLASGGSGWWAFWLIHMPSKEGVGVWSEYVQSAKNLGAKK